MRNDDDHNLYVDSYKVQWKKGSGSWETPADVTEAGYAPSGPRFFEGYVISGLTPGVEYDVRVIATNAVGDSEPSNVASGMVEPNSSGQQSNSPARGGPGIQGTPRTGETLTATTSSIRDDDGLDNAVFAYQWVRSELGAKTGTDIAGATGPSYVVTDDDEGKAITVLVTFKDDAGNRESVISNAVVAATALPQTQVPDEPNAPDVSAQDSTSLAVAWTEPASDGGSAITGYKVQWKEAADSWETPEDVSEAAVPGTSHTITGLTDGTEYSVRVLAINDVGESLPSEDGSGTPRETVPPELSEASVDGAALTLAFSEDLTETPLPAVTTFTVTVGQDARGVDSLEISGSTVTLTLASAVTSSDQVSVSYTVPTDAAAARLKDLSDNPAESFADQAVTNNTAAAQRRSRQQQENSPATGSPTISGTAQVGETLTASTTDISDTDGLTKVSYAYQWTANDGTSDSDIADATTSTYTLVPSDVGKTIKVKVTFTDDAGNGELLPSAATAAVAAAVPGAPASLRVSVNDTGKLDLSWEAPETDGGSAVIGYKVQWKEAVDSSKDLTEGHAKGQKAEATGRAEPSRAGSQAGETPRVRTPAGPDSGAQGIDAALPLIGHCSPPVWVGVMKGARPRRSGPPPRARDVGDAAPGMLALGLQVWETQGRDDLLADVQVEVLHVVDHHLG